MKQHHSIFPPAASLACALILMLAACTSDALDELPPAGTDPDARPLTITVSDGGMYATGQTRAQERGYSTVFTEGDCIGLYVVKDGTLEVKNLCLTLQGGKWTLPAGASQLLYSPDKSYHAYYPYQNDSDMNGKVSPGDEDFFKYVVDEWSVNPDQSTYAQYTASDLMTARGVYSNHTLSFAMEHRMSLFILQVPATKYTYTEKIDGQEISKSYYRYTAVINKNVYWQENPCTARLLVNTNTPTASDPGPYEYYYKGNRKTFYFDYSQLNLQPGKYTVHEIDGDEAIEERPLAAGDYYMQDGSILPGNEDGSLSRDEQESCLGVVFWVGEKPNRLLYSYHWTHTANKRGDHLLMHDHPGCVHGIVVALTNAGKTEWSSTSMGNTYTWLVSYAATGQEAEKKLMLESTHTFGYNTSRCIQWYRDYGGQRTEAYDAIEVFARTNPTPVGCSGWYFPSDYEMYIMTRGTLDLDEDYHMDTLLDAQFEKAGGSKFNTDDFYWSGTDYKHESHCMTFGYHSNSLADKRNKYYVRAVLAF